jgi:hypothetical protein
MTTVHPHPSRTDHQPVVASPRLRTVVRWVGGIFAIATLAAGSFKLLTTFAYDQNTVTATYSAAELGPVAEVAIRNSAGDVVVRGSRSREATVTSDVADGLFRARDGHRIEGNRLAVWGSCPVGFTTRCHVHHALDVPAGLDVAVTGRLGNIDVAGMTGALRLDSRFGRVSVEQAGGPLTIDHDFGVLTATALTSPTVEVAHEFGDTTISFVEAPTEVRVRTRFGATVIEVPDDGTAYRITGSTDLGVRTVYVRTDPGSDRVIHVDTRFGDATIRYAG